MLLGTHPPLSPLFPPRNPQIHTLSPYPPPLLSPPPPGLIARYTQRAEGYEGAADGAAYIERVTNILHPETTGSE